MKTYPQFVAFEPIKKLNLKKSCNNSYGFQKAKNLFQMKREQISLLFIET